MSAEAVEQPSSRTAGLARLVDFHAHWLPPELAVERPAGVTNPALRHVWPLLSDIDAAIDAGARDGVKLRVLSTPLEMLTPSRERADPRLVERINDRLADVVRERGPRLAALATIDPFAGEAAAEEARRAVDELGLPGIFVPAVSGELLLDAPAARPVLEFAAERGVPVFAHPVNPPVLSPRFASVAGAGHALGRATESAISTLALLRSGLLRTLPGLRVVITQLGSPVLLLAHYLIEPEQRPEGAPDGWRPIDDRACLFVDTAGFEPIAIRAAIEAVGIEHVLVGSDWPIAVEMAPARVVAALRQAGVRAEDINRIAAGTALDLLRIDLPAPTRGDGRPTLAP
jgi:predicted TIM-barrel fold metal-dependent hydrolase